MRRTISLLAVLILSYGCTDPASSTDETVDRKNRAAATLKSLQAERVNTHRSISVPRGEELQLIEQILSNFEGDEREVLRLILFDSTNHQLYTLGDARLDRMLQRIYEIRSASDPLLKRFTAVHPAIAERVPVLVILQDQIGHRSASAVIVRDPTGSPQNQVLLKATGDGGANLLAAVATLQDIWRREGVVPEKPVRYAVRATTELGQTQTSDLIRARKWFERILNKDPGATGQLHHSATIHIGRTEDVRRVP